MSPERLTVTILGAGTSTGVPVPGCSCAVCTSGLPENSRTRCSALLSFAGRNILIDASTDLRQQALREGITRIDAVLFTHTHADHVHGIDDLRPFNRRGEPAIAVYGSAETIATLRRRFSYIFDAGAEPGYRPRLETREASAPFRLFGLPIEPLPLRHGSGQCLGYRIGPFAYLADCSAIPKSSWDLLGGLEALVIDALRFRPHATHFTIAQALKVAEALAPKRTLLTHLSHDVDYPRHAPDLPPGVELARDGQSLSLLLDAAGKDTPKAAAGN